MTKAPDNHRQMSDAELDNYLKEMHAKLTEHLDTMQGILPPGYLITFVARHPEVQGAEMILTKDANLEAVADAILANHRTVVKGDLEGGKDDKKAA
jgi:hypothetical protein